MVGPVGGDGIDCFGEGVGLGRVGDCEFLGECGIEFSGVEEGDVVVPEVICGRLVEFEGVDALAVLVDQLDHVLEEGVQAFALEIQTDQVARVVPLCPQQLLCISLGLPMLLFCIIVLFI